MLLSTAAAFADHEEACILHFQYRLYRLYVGEFTVVLGKAQPSPLSRRSRSGKPKPEAEAEAEAVWFKPGHRGSINSEKCRV